MVAVHRAEHRDLRLGARRSRPRDDPVVEVAAPRRLGEGQIADIAASTRGSSCATSATTSVHPGRRAPRVAAPAAAAASPRRTTPSARSRHAAGHVQGRQPAAARHSSSHAQPLALMSRISFLYSSSGAITGWSYSASSHRLVERAWIPDR